MWVVVILVKNLAEERETEMFTDEVMVGPFSFKFQFHPPNVSKEWGEHTTVAFTGQMPAVFYFGYDLTTSFLPATIAQESDIN